MPIQLLANPQNYRSNTVDIVEFCDFMCARAFLFGWAIFRFISGYSSTQKLPLQNDFDL